MMIVPYRPEHGLAILQTAAEGANVAPRFMSDLEGYSAVMDSGEVVCCAGLSPWPDFPHIATAWAFVSRNISSPAYLAITRAALAFLETRQEQRIEAMCRADFFPARRWLVRLGFKPEGIALKYAPDGSDFLRFARIK